MNGLTEGFRWLANPEHWMGSDRIPLRLLQHVELSAVAIVMAALIALPIGLAVGHTHRGEVIAVQVANLGRAIPSLAILSLAFIVAVYLFPSFAFGFLPTLLALTLLGIPPILVNTYVGIQQVDPDTVEAARGMGMSGREVLFGLEVPLAMPLIVTGLRLAAVTIVATATLSALIAGGTLGRYIVDGYAQQDIPKVVGGSILIAALAIATDVLFSLLRRITAPRLSSSGERAAPTAV
ncbi:MAG: ABC transporter permease [Actinomycetota bacterium]|nr:ABC transporter permease [Actinomycetota bacterium]